MVTLMTIDRQPSVPDDGGWLERAANKLESLGFELLEPDHTRGDETSHMVAALRPKPTLQHFDPDYVDYWTSDGVRGRAAKLTREDRLPIAGEFEWGRITLVDRLGVENGFLSFGGTLRAQLTADGTVYVDFASNAPILRWAGHSQSTDPLSAEVGVFFARLKVPIDFVPGTEALITKAAPRTLYCAFIQYEKDRLTQIHSFREANRWLADWTIRESQRQEAAAKDDWQAAIALRRQLSAVEAIARE
jgi:hypothetical protein